MQGCHLHSYAAKQNCRCSQAIKSHFTLCRRFWLALLWKPFITFVFCHCLQKYHNVVHTHSHTPFNWHFPDVYVSASFSLSCPSKDDFLDDYVSTGQNTQPTLTNNENASVISLILCWTVNSFSRQTMLYTLTLALVHQSKIDYYLWCTSLASQVSSTTCTLHGETC